MITLQKNFIGCVVAALLLIAGVQPMLVHSAGNGIDHLSEAEQREILLDKIRELTIILQRLQAQVATRAAAAEFDMTTQRLGAADTPIEIETFVDYRSPFAQYFHETLQRLVAEYDGKVSVQYRHFPLTQLHPDAPTIARLMVCVGHLGGQEDFVELSDSALLPDPVTGWSVRPYSVIYDEALGLQSRETLDTCIGSEMAASVVEADYQYGLDRGVQGVPMSFISTAGQEAPINGAMSYDIMKNTIDNILLQLDI